MNSVRIVFALSLVLLNSAQFCVAKESKEKAKGQKAMDIKDHIWINAAPEKIFGAITEGAQLAKWWPKKSTSTPKKGGKLVLYWFGDGKLETAFETFEKNKKVAFPFYCLPRKACTPKP